MGVKQNFDLYHYLKKIIFIALLLIQRTYKSRKTLRVICNEGIEFQPAMLKWKAGPKKEDGVWAKYWYENIHRSTGFEPFKEKQTEISLHLEKIYLESKPYYDFLFQHTLKA